MQNWRHSVCCLGRRLESRFPHSILTFVADTLVANLETTKASHPRFHSPIRHAPLRAASIINAGIAQAIGVIANACFYLYLALHLDPSGFGEFVVATAFSLLASSIASSGYDTLTIRWAARYHASGDGQLQRYLWHARRISIVRSSILGGAILTGAFVASALGLIDTAMPLAIAAFRTPLVSRQRIDENALRGCSSVFWGLASLWLTPALSLLLLLGVPDNALSSAVALLANWVAMLAVAVISHGLVKTKVKSRFGAPLSPPTPNERAEWANEASPLALLTITMAAHSQCMPLLIAFLLGSEGAGLFGIAVRIAVPLQMVAEAVALVVTPRIAAAHSQGNHWVIQQHLRQCVGITFPATAILTVVLWTNAVSILSWFDPSYMNAVPVLRILTLGYLMQAACGPVGQTLNMTGHGWVTVRAIGSALAVSLGLTMALAPWAHAAGAATGSAVGLTLWSVWLAVEVRRRLGVNSTILLLPANTSHRNASSPASATQSRAA